LRRFPVWNRRRPPPAAGRRALRSQEPGARSPLASVRSKGSGLAAGGPEERDRRTGRWGMGAARLARRRRLWKTAAVQAARSSVRLRMFLHAQDDGNEGEARSLACAARPAGPEGVRATRAAAAGDGAWPGGPAAGLQTCAWARRSGPGVGRSVHGGAGPPRSLRGAVHRRPGRLRALERETMAVCPAFNSFTGFRNCVTQKF
jgi:hypothetical protein